MSALRRTGNIFRGLPVDVIWSVPFVAERNIRALTTKIGRPGGPFRERRPIQDVGTVLLTRMVVGIASGVDNFSDGL